jgi:DNA replication protein DnaC
LALVATYVKLLPDSARNGTGLYLWGGNGFGKTHMAAKVGLAAIKAGIATRFFTTDDFLTAIKGTWDKNAEDRQRAAREWLDQQAKAELVIIDDFAAERLGLWGLDEVFRLINDCVNANKALVLTSNLALDKVEKLLEGTNAHQSHRIVSRLRGAVVDTQVLAVGDYRAAQGDDMRQQLEAAAGIAREQGA